MPPEVTLDEIAAPAAARHVGVGSRWMIVPSETLIRAMRGAIGNLMKAIR